MSEPASTSPRQSPSRRWGRWVRRVVVGGLVAVGLLVAFHRPLVHWAIDSFGPRAAARAGLEASWRSTGSVLGGLGLEAVEVKGGEGSMIRAIKAEEVALSYDLWRWRSSGPGGVVESVKIRKLEVDLDLTHPTSAPPKPSRARTGAAPSFPSVRIPVIDVEDVTLRLQLGGGRVEVVRFSLLVDPSKPGRIQVERVVAPGIPELVGAKGVTKTTDTRVTLENLVLWPGVRVETLAVDVARLESGRIGIDFLAHQAEATVRAVGALELGGADGVATDMEVTVSGVTSETLAFWGVPDGGMRWASGEVDVRIKGPVVRPDRLVCDVTVRGAAVEREGLPKAAIDASAVLRAGTATLTDARVAAGRGHATVHGTARFSDSWAAVADAEAQVDAEFQFPDLEAWVPPGSGVSASVNGSVQAAVSKRALGGVEAQVEAARVRVHGLPAEAVTARLTTTDGGRVQFVAEAKINDTNRLSSTGWLDLRESDGFEANWNASCRNLATVPIEARSQWPWPTEGSVEATGRATGNWKALSRRDWSALAATAQVDVARFKMRDGRLDSLKARANVAGGRATVGEVVLRFDAENVVTGSGQWPLPGASGGITAKLKAALPALPRLSAWSTSFGGPALRAGAVNAEWDGGGGAGLLDMQGAGSIAARGVMVDGLPEPVSVETAVQVAGKTVSLKSMRASLGDWRVEGAASWDGVRADVPSLKASLKDRPVAALSASLPIGNQGAAAGSPILSETAPLRFKADIQEIDLASLAKARTMPIQGLVKANAEFSGTLQSLNGRLDVQARGLKPTTPPKAPKAAALEPATVMLSATLRNGQATVDATATQKPLQPARLQGRAPVDVAGLVRGTASVRAIPLSGRMTVPDSSLGFLSAWVPSLQSVKGTVGMEASLAGTVGQPQWQATARVQVPEARLHGAALPSIKDLSIKIQANERRLTVQEASVMLAGGRLSVDGGADLTKLADPVLDLRLRAEEVLVVRDDTVSLRANADVACRGPVSRAQVAGAIDLVRGRVFKEVEFLPLSLPNQLPPPPPPTALAKAGPPSLPPPIDAWTFDLAIRTKDPVRLMGNVVRGSVAADLKLAGSGARPVLTGKATMEQMWVKLPFSRLNITEGAVIFTEDKPFDPQINVVGESITDGRIVQVMVQGRALDPKLRLTSSPPLPEGDIAALLATGVTTSDLSSRGDEAAGRAAYLLVQQTYRKLFRQTSRRQDDAEPPRLSFDFSFFGNDPSRRSVSAIYELNPKWRVIGRVGEAGTFRGLVYYLIRFR